MRAITGVYFQKLITTSAAVGGVLLALLWVLIVWLTTRVDPLWGLFFLALMPLTIVCLVVYGLMLKLGKELVPRPLTKVEIVRVTKIGDKLFQTADAAATPWFYHLILIGKDVLRGKESKYIKETIEENASLRDDFLKIRKLFL